jgi:hypothetical protein
MRIILIALLLSGCAVTHYSIETPDGVTVSVWNTKDYESYEMIAEKKDDSWSVNLVEKGVSASDPSAVTAENMSKIINLIPVKP